MRIRTHRGPHQLVRATYLLPQQTQSRERPCEGPPVARAAIPDAIDKQGRRAFDAASLAALHVPRDAGRDRGNGLVGREALEVEAEALRLTAEVVRLEMRLVGEQQIVHLPEAALSRCGLRRRGGRLGMGMDADERKAPEHELEGGPDASRSEIVDIAARVYGHSKSP